MKAASRSAILIALLLASCRSAAVPVRALQDDCGQLAAHELLNAVLWMQRAAEYRASTRQVFATARVNLERALADPTWPPAVAPPDSAPPPQRYAVIVDADETILDNSLTAAAQILAGQGSFDREAWARWEEQGAAPALEGAVEFLAFAAARGVTVFFVSNRRNEAGLRKNLAALGVALPAQPDVVLVRGECDGAADKSCRRQAVARKYRVVLLIGDDLGDFLSVEGLSAAARLAAVGKAADRWGREWLVLPNPVYGSWERALLPPDADDCTRVRAKLAALQTP